MIELSGYLFGTGGPGPLLCVAAGCFLLGFLMGRWLVRTAVVLCARGPADLRVRGGYYIVTPRCLSEVPEDYREVVADRASAIGARHWEEIERGTERGRV